MPVPFKLRMNFKNKWINPQVFKSNLKWYKQKLWKTTVLEDLTYIQDQVVCIVLIAEKLKMSMTRGI